MAVVEVNQSDTDAKTESYGTGRAREVRLTDAEARLVNYVFCGWDSEIGLGSNYGSMISALSGAAYKSHHCISHGAHAAPLDPGERAEESERKQYEEKLAIFKVARRMCEDCKRKRMQQIASRYCPKHRKSSRDKHSISQCTACAQMRQRTAVPSSPSHGVRVDADSGCERWASKARQEREDILRCWRAIGTLARDSNRAAILLKALYGDMPPGLPARGYWKRNVDTEYRRVIRCVTGLGGAAIDTMLQVNGKIAPGESLSNWRARVLMDRSLRTAKLVEMAHRCERAIERAVYDYREAWGLV